MPCYGSQPWLSLPRWGTWIWTTSWEGQLDPTGLPTHRRWVCTMGPQDLTLLPIEDYIPQATEAGGASNLEYQNPVLREEGNPSAQELTLETLFQAQQPLSTLPPRAHRACLPAIPLSLQFHHGRFRERGRLGGGCHGTGVVQASVYCPAGEPPLRLTLKEVAPFPGWATY